jgi:hypothetical protein
MLQKNCGADLFKAGAGREEKILKLENTACGWSRADIQPHPI